MTVPERMLSLAIGREGQNARLAARLTGWRIDIRSDVSVAEAKAAATEPAATAPAAEAAATPAVEASADEPAAADVEAVEAVAAGEADTGAAVAKPAKATKPKATKPRAEAKPKAEAKPNGFEGARHQVSRDDAAKATTASEAAAPTDVEAMSASQRAKARRGGRGRQCGQAGGRAGRGRCRQDEDSREADQGHGRGVVVGAAAALERREAPTRTCVQCRSSKDKRELLRIVRTPAGHVVFDESGKANGRGAYVCRD